MSDVAEPRLRSAAEAILIVADEPVTTAAIAQALGLDPLLAQLELLLAQGDAEHLGAILSRGEARQPAPAATDVEQVVTCLQAQLAA